MKINVKWLVLPALALLCMGYFAVAQEPMQSMSSAAGPKGKLEPGAKEKIPCKIYVNCEDAATSPFAPSGWRGITEALEYDECCKQVPHSAPSCIRATYSAPKGWGGIVWQHPANNWGEEEGGIDLTGARQISFWAKGEQGGEKVSFKMGVIGKKASYWDSGSAGLENVRLTKEWKQYVIPLKGKNLIRIITGFSFSAEGRRDPVTFFIDDIVYE